MKIMKSDLISAYAPSISIGTAKELITKKINAAGLEDRENYTNEEIARICGELTKEGGLVRIIAQTFLGQLERKLRKQMEEAWQGSEERFRTLIETIPDGIYFKDAQGRNIVVNMAYERFLGLEKEEIIGKTDEELLPPDLVEMNKRSDEEVIKKGMTVRVEGQTNNGGDEQIFFEVIKTPFHDAPGNIMGVVGVIRDITERKRAEIEREHFVDDLEKKTAELERFVYTVAHDLRTPLVTIHSFCGMLRKDMEKGEEEKIEIEFKMIENAAAKMDHLLKDTLALSRIGRVVNPPEDVPFGELVQEALEQTAGGIKLNNIEVSVAEDFPFVHVDRVRIAEVLKNLVGNSINYMSEQPNPKIDIGYYKNSDKNVFFVRDNGIGIAPNQHEKVFGLFYQVEKNNKGTGIGLAVVKRIIEVHNGRVWIESEKGKGCTICFTLPPEEEKK